MKTLKISVVATIATVLAWVVRLPQKMWPGHPQMAAFFLALILCLALQFVWTEGKPETSTAKKEK